ncbi:uncharacterized protein LOC123539461 isoform X2 [Mercenaria mercenaria]|uniref:uncharacterized protein LOC123539461 isoform X2 n=1 Tax=Mercenaria mercenaria TaxID=6596 RepID=UPI00234EC96A|nr:uncharacterized protein LOC123539461 isoform X2 [Mercenaria mercenaria]
MDGDDKKYRGVDHSQSDSDGVHETSFNTASEGGASDPSDRSLMHHDDKDAEEPIRSSRSMPVPEYLRGRPPLAHTETIDEENEAPPPSYDEAVTDYKETSGGKNAEEDTLTPDEIAVIMRSHEDMNAAGLNKGGATASGGNDLTPEQQAMYDQRKKDRNSYLPSSDRRDSYEEAMEMKSRASLKIPASEQRAEAPAVDTTADMAPMEMEDGGRREEYTCSGWGPLDEPMTRFCRFLRRQSLQRLILFSLLIMAGIGLLLFVGLFPASFVYVDYHQIALKQSKMTNVVDRESVYYPGCYVLGPDTKLLFFTGSVHNIVEEMSVFTVDTITVSIRYSVHYFIRPPEVGKLFTVFMFDYDDVFRKIIRSSMRNLAGSTLTVDNFRFNRTYVETQMHAMLRKRLGGDCCPQCCKEKLCQSNTYCSTCRTGSCDQGYHVDVRFFRLLSVSIAREIFERLLYRTILEVRKEKEFFLQEHAVTKEETKRITSSIKNEAKEIIQKGQFEANKIASIAEADKEKVVQNSYVIALNELYSRLNVTREDHKLSLMMIRALEESSDNLYSGFGFEKNTLFAP